MKRIFALLSLSAFMLVGISACGQAKEDKSKRPSPPTKVTKTIKSGATISIDYSQPSVKGRTIGKDLEPMDGKVWRTGANEATVFETSKDVKINDGSLPAGKYALFTIADDNGWTVIFNKTWNQWGAYDYKEADDALRIKAPVTKGNPNTEKMTFTIGDDGTVSMLWADRVVKFTVQ